jgi:hypothetical protein
MVGGVEGRKIHRPCLAWWGWRPDEIFAGNYHWSVLIPRRLIGPSLTLLPCQGAPEAFTSEQYFIPEQLDVNHLISLFGWIGHTTYRLQEDVI